MKRRLALMLALMLTLGLAACGGSDEPENACYVPRHVADIDQAGAFSETLEELDGDVAFTLYRLADYGLTQEDMKECAVLRSAGATCEEAAVLGFTDSDKAESAEQAMKDYVQSQIDANRDYRPAEIPKLEEALVDRRGESVLLVVAEDRQAAEHAVE